MHIKKTKIQREIHKNEVYISKRYIYRGDIYIKEQINKRDIYKKEIYIRRRHTIAGYIQGVKSSVHIVKTYTVRLQRRFTHKRINI